MFHQIYTGGFLRLPAAAGVQNMYQILLQRFCQGFTALLAGMEYLSPGISAVGEGVLVDAEQYGSGSLIADAHPLFQIGHLFLGDGLPFRVYGNVLRPDHSGLIAKKMKHVPEPQADLQIIGTFRLAGDGYRSPIHAPMAWIDDEAVLPLRGHILGKYGNSPVSQADKGECQQNGCGIADLQQKLFLQGHHLAQFYAAPGTKMKLPA